jgi:hypothetical protein
MVDRVAPFIGDDAYNMSDGFTAVRERHLIAAVVPPRSIAVAIETAPDLSDPA